MSAELVLRHEEEGIVTLTLNRQEHANALSSDLLLALMEHVTEIAQSMTTRVVVITGAGEKVFCAGADLKERRGMSDAQVKAAVGLIRQTIEAVAKLPQPVIAKLNGGAFGGGAELALACDLRIAARHIQIGLTETSLAIIPGAGGTQRLPRLIGVAKAKELIYTARRVNTAEALSMGLVNEVVDGTDLAQRVTDVALAIAANGPVALRQAKLAIDKGADTDLNTGLQIETLAYELVIPTEDRLEGLAAFAEKRKPQYKGK